MTNFWSNEGVWKKSTEDLRGAFLAAIQGFLVSITESNRKVFLFISFGESGAGYQRLNPGNFITILRIFPRSWPRVVTINRKLTVLRRPNDREPFDIYWSNNMFTDLRNFHQMQIVIVSTNWLLKKCEMSSKLSLLNTEEFPNKWL